jgi:hypothetical protein
MNIADKKYFFIAGQPKAGTSSLHKWLLQHPDICGSSIKETRFFLDDSYPLERPYVFDGSNLERYLRFFASPDSNVLMDATPDYLYSENALAAAKVLPNARAVIILRDPVERMISAFRFFKQSGRVPADMSLSDYVQFQDQNKVTSKTPVQFRALDHCRTNFYLQRWQAAFGNRLLVLSFEALKENPSQCIDEVVSFLGLEKISLDNDFLNPENKTKVARSPILSKYYSIFRRKLSQAMMDYPQIKSKLKPVSISIRQILFKELVDPAPEVDSKTAAIIKSWSEVAE